MNFPDALHQPDRRMLRQFAAGWVLFFLIAGARVYWRGRTGTGLGFGVIALLGPLLCWSAPALFRKIFLGWMWLAFPIGWLVSQVVLGLLFYAVVTPLAFFLRLGGRDRLMRTRPTNASSYWKKKTAPKAVQRYFRPY